MELGCWRFAMMRALLGMSGTTGGTGVRWGTADEATPSSAGRGSAYDYRPSPRQLRRSSPKRMMQITIAEARDKRTSRISMRDTLQLRVNGDPSLHFVNHGGN
jgi:hypothetical protein